MGYRQGLLFESNWGGKRRGAGRKGKGRRHTARNAVQSRRPLHVVWRGVGGMRSWRRREVFVMVSEAIRVANEKSESFRVVEFSLQSNHIHMIVEAEDGKGLARGMQGLGVRLARGINRLFRRTGKVFESRFFARVLKTPKEVRRALVYVLQNFKKHCDYVESVADHLSSGAWFGGWKEKLKGFLAVKWVRRPVREARSWLLRQGWKREGLICVFEGPR